MIRKEKERRSEFHHLEGGLFLSNDRIIFWLAAMMIDCKTREETGMMVKQKEGDKNGVEKFIIMMRSCA